jgi:hypothetical protein
LNKGKAVRVIDEETGSWNKGTVSKSNSDGTYDVESKQKNEDGQPVVSQHVERKHMRTESTFMDSDIPIPKQSSEASTPKKLNKGKAVRVIDEETGSWNKATVTKSNVDGTYDIEVEKSDKDSNMLVVSRGVQPGHVRTESSFNSTEISVDTNVNQSVEGQIVHSNSGQDQTQKLEEDQIERSQESERGTEKIQNHTNVHEKRVIYTPPEQAKESRPTRMRPHSSSLNRHGQLPVLTKNLKDKKRPFSALPAGRETSLLMDRLSTVDDLTSVDELDTNEKAFSLENQQFFVGDSIVVPIGDDALPDSQPHHLQKPESQIHHSEKSNKVPAQMANAHLLSHVNGEGYVHVRFDADGREKMILADTVAEHNEGEEKERAFILDNKEFFIGDDIVVPRLGDSDNQVETELSHAHLVSDMDADGYVQVRYNDDGVETMILADTIAEHNDGEVNAETLADLEHKTALQSVNRCVVAGCTRPASYCMKNEAIPSRCIIHGIKSKIWAASTFAGNLSLQLVLGDVARVSPVDPFLENSIDNFHNIWQMQLQKAAKNNLHEHSLWDDTVCLFGDGLHSCFAAIPMPCITMHTKCLVLRGAPGGRYNTVFWPDHAKVDMGFLSSFRCGGVGTLKFSNTESRWVLTDSQTKQPVSKSQKCQCNPYSISSVRWEDNELQLCECRTYTQGLIIECTTTPELTGSWCTFAPFTGNSSEQHVRHACLYTKAPSFEGSKYLFQMWFSIEDNRWFIGSRLIGSGNTTPARITLRGLQPDMNILYESQEVGDIIDPTEVDWYAVKYYKFKRRGANSDTPSVSKKCCDDLKCHPLDASGSVTAHFSQENSQRQNNIINAVSGIYKRSKSSGGQFQRDIHRRSKSSGGQFQRNIHRRQQNHNKNWLQLATTVEIKGTQYNVGMSFVNELDQPSMWKMSFETNTGSNAEQKPDDLMPLLMDQKDAAVSANFKACLPSDHTWQLWLSNTGIFHEIPNWQTILPRIVHVLSGMYRVSPIGLNWLCSTESTLPMQPVSCTASQIVKTLPSVSFDLLLSAKCKTVT